MIEQTDIRNKKTLLQRKSQYAQMSGQIEQMDETIKNQQGTIDTLERQVIQAGIKDKINQGEKVINKEVTQTQAEQKLLQRMMKGEADLQKKEMKIARKNVASNNNSS
jgi:hypothetical protein